MGESLTVAVWRGRANGQFATYAVPFQDNQTVLDVVTYIQRHIDATLSYRFACRVGMCGSCAMTVNGAPRWTCRTHVRKVLRGGQLEIRPLENFPVIKDLSVAMDPFFEKWQRARGTFVPTADRHHGFAPIAPESPARQAADAGIECIGCGICYAACDLVRWQRDYLGPAALNRAWTLVNDTRDGGQQERLRAVAGDAGCHACHSQQSCRQWCPQFLNPTASIAGLKRKTARAVIAGQL